MRGAVSPEALQFLSAEYRGFPHLRTYDAWRATPSPLQRSFVFHRNERM